MTFPVGDEPGVVLYFDALNGNVVDVHLLHVVKALINLTGSLRIMF